MKYMRKSIKVFLGCHFELRKTNSRIAQRTQSYFSLQLDDHHANVMNVRVFPSSQAKMFVWLHVMQYSYQFCSFISFVMKIEQTSTLRAIRNHFTGSFFCNSLSLSLSPPRSTSALCQLCTRRIGELVSNSTHINN